MSKLQRRSRVIYTGHFQFPEGNAAAVHVLNIGKALRDAGFEVVFAGAETDPRPEEKDSAGRYISRGFEYVALGDGAPAEAARLRRATNHFTIGTRTVEWLKTLDPETIHSIVVYNAMTAFSSRLQRFCRARNIPLVLDLTEWYEPPSWVSPWGLLRGFDIE